MFLQIKHFLDENNIESMCNRSKELMKIIEVSETKGIKSKNKYKGELTLGKDKTEFVIGEYCDGSDLKYKDAENLVLEKIKGSLLRFKEEGINSIIFLLELNSVKD